MNREDQEILEELGSWLRGRARHLARRLGGGEDPQDIEQDVLAIFYEKGPEWLKAPPEVSRVAQIRYWLNICLQRVSRDRFQDLASWGGSVGSDDDEDEQRSYPEPSHGGERDEIERLDRERALAAVLEDIQERLLPPRRLYLLATYFPDRVERSHLEVASTFRMGGAVPLRRTIDESWELFCEQRAIEELVQDAPNWKKRLAELFRLQGSFGSHSEREMKKAVNYVDMQLSRALDDLRKLSKQGQDDER